MTKHSAENNQILYSIAEYLHLIYQEIIQDLDYKAGRFQLTPQMLLNDAKEQIDQDDFDLSSEAKNYLLNSLQPILKNDIYDTFETIVLEIKSPDPEKPSAIYSFGKNPYIQEITWQLHTLFSCASELLKSDEQKHILEIMAHHYAYAYQQFLSIPIGDFWNKSWHFSDDSTEKEEINKIFCVAESVLAHAINDILVILMEYGQSSAFARLFKTIQKHLLYKNLLKVYEQKIAKSPVRFYFFGEHYWEHTVFHSKPFRKILPPESEAVKIGAQSPIYKQILNFLADPLKNMKQSVSSELTYNLNSVVSKEKKEISSSQTMNSQKNPWPYSYVPIPLEELVEDNKLPRFKAIIGDAEKIDSLEDFIKKFRKKVQAQRDLQIHLDSDKHHASIEWTPKVSLKISTKSMILNESSDNEEQSAFALDVQLNDNADPSPYMKQIIQLANDFHYPYFYIVGDRKNLPLTKQFLAAALAFTKNTPETCLQPKLIGLDDATCYKLSQEARKEAGYPTQNFSDSSKD